MTDLCRHKVAQVHPAPHDAVPSRLAGVVVMEASYPAVEPRRHQLCRMSHSPARRSRADLRNHRPQRQLVTPRHPQSELRELHQLPEASRIISRLHPRLPRPTWRVSKASTAVRAGPAGIPATHWLLMRAAALGVSTRPPAVPSGSVSLRAPAWCSANRSCSSAALDFAPKFGRGLLQSGNGSCRRHAWR